MSDRIEAAMTVFQYHPGVMRSLSTNQLINLLAAFQNVRAEYAEIKNNCDIAGNNIESYKNQIHNEASGILGAIVAKWLLIPGVLMVISAIAESGLLAGLLLGILGAGISLAIIGFFIVFVLMMIKPIRQVFEEKIEPKYRQQIAAETRAYEEWERKRVAFWNGPKMSKLEEFRSNEGKSLDIDNGDLDELFRILYEGRADTFGQAMNVLDNWKNERKRLELEKVRVENERAHQLTMEYLARQQQKEEQYHNAEMQRAAREIADNTRRAADAEEERTRTINDMFGY
ncbi:MAG: hypothetical protein ACSW8F_00385 [bacterium]